LGEGKPTLRGITGQSVCQLLVLGILAGTVLLPGCGGTTRSGNPALAPGSGPVQLGRQGGGDLSVLLQLDEIAVGRSIENYRINKKRAAGPYQLAGADLNEDGTAEAIVLFGGKDWCAKTGCSMAIFRSGPHGYVPISRTVRVKAPVVISRDISNGWRDLFVSTGGGAAPLRRIRLRFSGSGYARNAMLEEELPPDVPQTGETAIAASVTAATPAR
jgi:hypothetical protein